MANKKRGETPFEKKSFHGNVLVRFMSQIEQDVFLDKYYAALFVARQEAAEAKVPSELDWAVTKLFEEGWGFTRIARESNLGVTAAYAQSAINRVGQYMLRVNKLSSSRSSTNRTSFLS